MLKKIKRLVIRKLVSPLYSISRVLKYRLLSTALHVKGSARYLTPALLKGDGEIIFNQNVTIGVNDSPSFYNTYCYLEARTPQSVINIGSNVYINNNACIISEGEGIYIGNDTLIGTNFTVSDTDFHHINPLERLLPSAPTKKVIIGKNVFIGFNVTVLKGVTIGDNSVIGSNSLVSKSIPANVVAGGNPCKVIRELIS